MRSRRAARWLLLVPAGGSLLGALVFLGTALGTARAQAPGPVSAPSATASAATAVRTTLPELTVALTPLPTSAEQRSAPGQGPAAPGPGSPTAAAPPRLTVGDPVEAVLTLRVPRIGLRGEPRFPVWRGSWGEAAVVEEGPAEKTGESAGVATYRQRLVIAAFRPGRVPLPPTAVAVPLAEETLEVTTPANLALEIASVLPAGREKLEAKPAAPPRPLPLGARFWWTAAGLSAACLAAGLLLWRRSREKAAASAAPALAPFAELAGALAALEAEESDLRLHTRLSLALRRYLGRSLGFPAAESTTTELHRRLAAKNLPAALVRQTVDLLRACDLVKFARQNVATARSRERLAAAREIASEVEAIVHPPVSLTPGETAAPTAPAPLRKAG